MHRSGRSAALDFRNFLGGHSVMVAVTRDEGCIKWRRNVLNVPTCDCHMLDFLSEHRKYSVTYDKERNAYFIDGFPMAYCFICGGSLPKWEPPVNEQPAPLADEEREARELVARCNSFQEVLSVLGAPDCLQYPTDDDDQTEWRRVSRVLAERQPECFANSEDTEWTRKRMVHAALALTLLRSL